MNFPYNKCATEMRISVPFDRGISPEASRFLMRFPFSFVTVGIFSLSSFLFASCLCLQYVDDTDDEDPNPVDVKVTRHDDIVDPTSPNCE